MLYSKHDRKNRTSRSLDCIYIEERRNEMPDSKTKQQLQREAKEQALAAKYNVILPINIEETPPEIDYNCLTQGMRFKNLKTIAQYVGGSYKDTYRYIYNYLKTEKITTEEKYKYIEVIDTTEFSTHYLSDRRLNRHYDTSLVPYYIEEEIIYPTTFTSPDTADYSRIQTGMKFDTLKTLASYIGGNEHGETYKAIFFKKDAYDYRTLKNPIKKAEYVEVVNADILNIDKRKSENYIYRKKQNRKPSNVEIAYQLILNHAKSIKLENGSIAVTYKQLYYILTGIEVTDLQSHHYVHLYYLIKMLKRKNYISFTRSNRVISINDNKNSHEYEKAKQALFKRFCINQHTDIASLPNNQILTMQKELNKFSNGDRFIRYTVYTIKILNQTDVIPVDMNVDNEYKQKLLKYINHPIQSGNTSFKYRESNFFY